MRVRSIRLDPFKKWASDLAEMVSRVRALPSASRPSSWAQSFRSLVRKGVSEARIGAALRWYASVLKTHGDLIRAGRTFIPIAYSGPRWLEKWDQIEQAMYRESGGALPNEGPKVRLAVRKTEKRSRSTSGGTQYEDNW